MIPDDTIIFNRCSALSNFDDHEVHLRHLLQQDAMPTLKDSRHLLSVNCLALSSRSAADGRANLWHGYVWNTPCVPLGGDVLVLLAVALPPPALSPFASLLVSWSVLRGPCAGL